MTGILPNNGVIPSATQNGIESPTLAPGCDNLYYGPRCNPRLDPFAMNAVISELINAINATGTAYDCSRLDNLATALQSLVYRGQLTETVFTATGPGSFVVPAGVTSMIVEGWGGGGGGGGGAAGVQAGGGGGGGGYFSKALAVTPGDTINYNVGAPGALGAVTVSGGSGGNTTVSYLAWTGTAGGGGGGVSGSGGAIGGAAGTATNGDENIFGSGGFTAFSSAIGGAGGAAARGGAGSQAGNNGNSPGGGGGAGPGNIAGRIGGGGAVRLTYIL